MEAYRELSCIGRGTQGSCHAVRHLEEGNTYVMKRMHIIEPEARRTALLEAEMLRRLQHTAIIGYRDTFVDGEYLCIVMEYAEGGDLASRIARAGAERPFSEEQILQWLAQLTLALAHVHERGVLHRDLKTHNVFLTSGGHVKLGDFGISKVLGTHERQLTDTVIGTPYYMSPELFRGEEYGAKADVWALGCVTYELAARRRAFQSPNLNSLSMRVMRGEHGPLPPMYSTGLLDLVKSLLTVNAHARPSLASLLVHPLLRRHIAVYADATLGAHSEAAVVASPSLAALRAQLNGVRSISPVSRRCVADAAHKLPMTARQRVGLAEESGGGGGSTAGGSASSGGTSARATDAVDDWMGGGGGGERKFREQCSVSKRRHGRRALPSQAEGGDNGPQIDSLALDFSEWATPPLECTPLVYQPPEYTLPTSAWPGALAETRDLPWLDEGDRDGGGGTFDSEGEHDEVPPAFPHAHAADYAHAEYHSHGDYHAAAGHNSRVVGTGDGGSSARAPLSSSSVNFGGPSGREISAKDRVLARREQRRRAEDAARQGELLHARQRYFQERVLADHAQRSQYLGSFVSHAPDRVMDRSSLRV